MKGDGTQGDGNVIFGLWFNHNQSILILIYIIEINGDGQNSTFF